MVWGDALRGEKVPNPGNICTAKEKRTIPSLKGWNWVFKGKEGGGRTGGEKTASRSTKGTKSCWDREGKKGGGGKTAGRGKTSDLIIGRKGFFGGLTQKLIESGMNIFQRQGPCRGGGGGSSGGFPFSLKEKNDAKKGKTRVRARLPQKNVGELQKKR